MSEKYTHQMVVAYTAVYSTVILATIVLLLAACYSIFKLLIVKGKWRILYLDLFYLLVVALTCCRLAFCIQSIFNAHNVANQDRNYGNICNYICFYLRVLIGILQVAVILELCSIVKVTAGLVSMSKHQKYVMQVNTLGVVASFMAAFICTLQLLCLI